MSRIRESNVDLFRAHRQERRSGLLPEFPWHVIRQPFMFRKRNRLIAGLARATQLIGRGFPAVHILYGRQALAANKDINLRCRGRFSRHIGGLEYVACAGELCP